MYKVALISTDEDTWALGMRGLSSVLKAAGHECKLVFMGSAKPTYTENQLAALAALLQDVDVIGFSCLAPGSDKAKQAIGYLRPLNKNRPIVWGGVHASLYPEDCVEWADLVCQGEGEGFLIELLERLEQGRDWQDLQNAAYRRDGVLVKNEVRPPVKNLDDLPMMDLTAENEYHLGAKGFEKITMLAGVKRNGEIAFNGSRGCAFICTYCCNLKLKNLYAGKDKYVRRMSIPRLIEHAEALKKANPQAKYFYFIDEDFSARPISELEQFAEEFPKRIGLPFECLAHPARITPEKMALLVKAGIWRIRMGIESGSERTKKEIYDRHVSNEVVLRACKIISGYPKVSTAYFFIMSNPYEERADLVDTISLIRALPNGAQLQMFDLIFFPGSTLYDRALRDKVIGGAQESGYLIDFRAGLHYEGIPWKKKNLYLNGLLLLLEGKTTAGRIGTLPRGLLDLFMRPGWIEYNETHHAFPKLLIALKHTMLSLRHFGARVLKKVLRDPMAVYNLEYYFKERLFGAKRAKPVG